MAPGCVSAPPAALAPAPPPAQGPLPVPEPGLARLEAGQPVEGELAGGGRAEVLLRAAAGDYLRLRIEQTGIDVAASLLGPAGEVLATVDGGGMGRPEVLSLVTPAGGELRLVVTAPAAMAPEGLYRIAVEEIRTGRPEDAERVATDRALADAVHRAGRGTEEERLAALASLQELLATWRRLGDISREAATLNELGRLQKLLGRNADALASVRAALGQAREAGEVREQARALECLGDIGRRLRAPRAEIERDFEESLALWRQLGDREGEGRVLFSLGATHADEGEADAALALYERALPLQETAAGPADQALTLAALALLARDRGEPARASDLFERGLALARRSADGSAQGFLLQSTASFHLRRGQLQQAIERFEEALEIYRTRGERSQEAEVLSNLGSAHLYLGNSDSALDRYREALALFQALKESRGECNALIYLGTVHQLRGDAEEALKSFTRALEIAPSPVTRGAALYFMGRTLLAAGHPPEAEAQLTEAIGLQQQTGGNPVVRARTLLALAHAHRALGRDDLAAGELKESLDIGRRLQNFLVEAAAQAALARLARDRGALDEALAASSETLRIIDGARSKLAGQRLRVSFLASRHDYYQLHLDILMRLHERDPQGGHLAAALTASDWARARGLVDLLAEGRIEVHRGIGDELRGKEAEIDSRLSALQAQRLDDLSLGAGDGARAARLEEETRRTLEERERLEWEIRREHPHYAAVRNPGPLSLAEIQGLLDERTAFLEYAVGDERSFLFVVTREGVESWTLPSAGALAALVQQVREGIERPGRRSRGTYLAAARELYQTLIAPAGTVLAGRSRLIVSPDGPLHFLAFETLLTTEPPPGQDWQDLPYLIRDKAVAYVPSARVLAELAPSSGGGRAPAPRLVAFADPTWETEATAAEAQTRFAAAGLPPFRPLAHTRREVDEISRLYPAPEVRLYLDREATEENVKNNDLLSGARRIHFATHGFIDERQPELSGLALSRPEDSREDGLLQVYEIFNLDLEADLVVLSACDTGLGRSVGGEGLVGLTRAFFYAGARSLVVSLWQVADASTADFMVDFYNHLDQDVDKAEALRLAKLQSIAEGRAHPYQWAPFLLIGQPR